MATTSKKIEIDTELLKTISKIAQDEKTTENQLIMDIIKRRIEKIENETTIEKIERISNGKVKVVNKNRYNASKKELNSIIGIATAPKGFDPVKAVQEVRRSDI